MMQTLDLRLMTLQIVSERVYTKEGVPMKVIGTAQVKIDAGTNGETTDLDHIRVSAENFLGKSQDNIQLIAKETLEGHQRAIMGTMTVEEIFQDRKKMSENIQQISKRDLESMGLLIVTYNIRDVADYSGYLKALEQGPVAEKKRDAVIGAANANMDMQIKKATAREAQMKQNLTDKTLTEDANRDLEVRKLKNRAETEARKVEAELAYELQEYKLNVDIVDARINEKIVNKQNQIKVLEQEAVRKERELETTVKEPANAEMYRQIQLAEAKQTMIMREAEAHAMRIRQEGQAKAQAIKAKGIAEANRKKKAAEAYAQFDRNAMVELYLKQLPRIAAEVAAPLQSVSKINMVSTGDGDLGVSRVLGEVTAMVDQVVGSVANNTGINLQNTIKGMKVNTVTTEPK